MPRSRVLGELFRTESPVFSDVTIEERWNVYDGVLSGLCRINGSLFYFCDCVFDMWRTYSEKEHDTDRLWRIFAVYDMEPNEVRRLHNKHPGLRESEAAIKEESDVIGIFWDYKYSEKFRKTHPYLFTN